MNEKSSSWPFSFFMTILKKFLPRELQFVREKTVVSCRMNCSFHRIKPKFSRELFFGDTSCSFQGFTMKNNVVDTVSLLYLRSVKITI